MKKNREDMLFMEDLFVFTWQVTRDRRVSVARECSSLDKKSNAGRTIFTPEAYRSAPYSEWY